MGIKNRNYNLIELSKKYPNKWVALTRDNKTVISIGNNLKEVILQAKKKDAVFMKLLPVDSFYIPFSL